MVIKVGIEFAVGLVVDADAGMPPVFSVSRECYCATTVVDGIAAELVGVTATVTSWLLLSLPEGIVAVGDEQDEPLFEPNGRCVG